MLTRNAGLGRPAVASSRRPIHATSSIASRQLPQRPSNSTNNTSSCSSGSALLLFKWHVIARATDNFRPGSPEQQQQKEEAPTQDLHEPTAPPSPASSPLVGVQQGGLPTAVQNPSQGPVDHDSSSGSTAKATDNSIKKSGVAKAMHWRELPSGASQLPPVPCRPVAVDASNSAGEFVEFETLGAGPFCLQRFKEFGPVFSWRLGPTKIVTVLDYEAIKSLLTTGDQNKVTVAWNPESFYLMMGEQSRISDPAVRLANRRLMQAAFSKEALVGYVDKLVGICRTQLDEWAASDKPVDLAARGKDLSFEFSTQLIVDFEVPPEQKPALRKKLDTLFQGLVSPPDPSPGSQLSRGIEARDQILEQVETLLRAREAKREASGSSGGAVVHRNVHDYTLDDQRAMNGGKLNYQLAAGSGMGLLIAGNDTSGIGISAILAVLSLFPEVLEKIRQEQQEVVKKHGPCLNPVALEAMTYADAVTKEVLRITPPAGAIFRRTTVDLEICGKFVPANSTLMLSTFMGQVVTDPHLKLGTPSKEEFERLEASWAGINAAVLRDEFKPERWLEDTSRPSGLLTFSAGPHVCLGMALFMAEAKVLLALLGRDYEITHLDSSPDVDFKVTFFTQLRQGAVKFSKKQQQPEVAVSQH